MLSTFRPIGHSHDTLLRAVVRTYAGLALVGSSGSALLVVALSDLDSNVDLETDLATQLNRLGMQDEHLQNDHELLCL